MWKSTQTQTPQESITRYPIDILKIDKTFVNKIDVMIVKVATQKNELASYRNELKEVIKLTTPNQTNGQRLIDLAGIVQYLDFKILKIENLQNKFVLSTKISKCEQEVLKIKEVMF